MRHSVMSESIDTARRRFFDDGAAPRGLVSDTILASWRRCLEQGLVASAKPSLMPLERRALGEMQERHEALRRLCRPELEALYASANQAGSIVVLTAPDGFILDALGDPDFLDKAARVSLRPGVPWSEQSTGTNAIGTALVERRSVEVRGAEHYHAPHRVLSCSASPIFDPQGQVVGVLDLSGHASVHHLHALGMVQLAVEQIEHRLFECAFDGADIVRIQPDPALIGTAREGMLVFQGHRLAAANRHALRLLGLDWSELGKRRYDELFASALPVPGSVASMRCQTGDMVHARRDPPRSRIHVPDSVRSARTQAPPKQAIRPLRAPATVFDAALDAAIERQVRLLDADITVLLQGETGTGKEVVARELHRRSARADAPFVAVNCASLPEALIESELFGHLPGAFTGARRDGAPGLLREAHGGVLFLDELGDMPLSLQSRLLRVLQEREVTPLGGGRAHAIDVRVIAATHRQLQQSVDRGEFRADLYFRVAQSVLHLPPLREHPDVADTVRRLWAALGAEQVPMRLAPDLVHALAARRWPGNVRELVGVLRSLMALGAVGATLSVDDLPDHWRQPPPDAVTPLAAGPAAGNLQALEAQAIDQALAACRGNMAAAARQLGISRSTLYRRMEARERGE
ncbi:MAG TPA: sigma-54-dependent Fis family transcriptional regulator [Dyella sp.]|nr:sigma-54-dependent Fis family transcriptional regulator [Dyella sp.]